MNTRVIIALTLLSSACGTSQAREEPASPQATTEAVPIDAISVWSTYYYRASEGDYAGPPHVTLYDAQCRSIAQVSDAFGRAACIEGSARLHDGRVINYARRCDCALPCANGARVCYDVVSGDGAPFGVGNRNNALEPLISWATDRDVIQSGTTIYAPEWNGLEVPAVDGLGGFVHDGCFRADDVGGAIDADHVDIFAGTRSMWQALEALRPTRSRQRAVLDSPRCSHLRR